MSLYSKGLGEVTLALTLLSGATLPAADETPVTATQSVTQRAEPSNADIYKQIGALEAKVSLVDLVFKNRPPTQKEALEWQARRDSIFALQTHASETMEKTPSLETRRTLSIALEACNKTLELYVSELADERIPAPAAATSPRGRGSKPTEQPTMIGVYDAAGFEGMKMGVRVLLPLMQENMRNSKIPAETQQFLTQSLTQLGEARDPGDLTQRIESMLNDKRTGAEQRQSIERFFSLLAPQKNANAAPPLEAVKDSPVAWREAWQQIVEQDKTPRLHPAGKRGYEVRCFNALAADEKGFSQIIKSATLLEAYFKDKNEALASKLAEIAHRATKDELHKFSPNALETLQRATEAFELETKKN